MPPSVPINKNAKVWWKYAIELIIKRNKERKREMNRMLWLLVNRRKYINSYKNMLLLDKINKDDMEIVNEIEMNRNVYVEDIFIMREIAMEEV